jgi:Raf kinase inhibitor-like YbhB/YbcL family protein
MSLSFRELLRLRDVIRNSKRLNAKALAWAHGLRWVLLVSAVALLLLPVRSPQALGGEPMRLSISLPAIPENTTVPKRFTCDGDNISPAVIWSGVPAGAKTLVLVVEDPDAPSGLFTHWRLLNLPASLSGLPEDEPKTASLVLGGEQAANDTGRIGYTGPCPPPGRVHHYHFKLYALSGALDLGREPDARKLIAGMGESVLARGETVVIYQR